MVRLLLIVGLILVTVGVYVNSLPGTFHYDDFPLLLENPTVTGDVFPFEAFLTDLWGRPLTLFSFHWNYQLVDAAPAWFHLVNCLLHLLSVVLLYAVIRLFRGKEFPAFATALIFAIHPIQSQAVNYVWSRSILLMSVCVLLCLLLWRRYPLLCLVVFQLAIWSRAEALLLGLPLIFLAPRRWKVVGLVAGINLVILSTAFFSSPPNGVAWTHSDPLSFWWAAPVALWKYIGLMIWPAPLSIDHPLVTWSVPASLGSLLAVVLLLVTLMSWRARHRSLLLGFSWLLLFLAPSLMIPNSDLVNESRSYLAFAGFALMLASLLEMAGEWISKVGERRTCLSGTPGRLCSPAAGASCSLLLIVCLIYSPLTLARNEVWQDDAMLWREAVSHAPSELRPLYNLGVALARIGDQEGACGAFSEALSLYPRDGLSHAALGYCAETRGDQQEALQLYRAANRIDPENQYARLRIRVIEADNLEGGMDR
jgi:hypothetical protein